MTLRLSCRWLLAFALTMPFGQVSAAKAQAAKTEKTAPARLVDINTASREALKALPGIGDVYADRIIKGRPYTAKTQLAQKGIIPSGTYARIEEMLIAKRPR